MKQFISILIFLSGISAFAQYVPSPGAVMVSCGKDSSLKDLKGCFLDTMNLTEILFNSGATVSLSTVGSQTISEVKLENLLCTSGGFKTEPTDTPFEKIVAAGNFRYTECRFGIPNDLFTHSFNWKKVFGTPVNSRTDSKGAGTVLRDSMMLINVLNDVADQLGGGYRPIACANPSGNCRGHVRSIRCQSAFLSDGRPDDDKTKCEIRF